MSYQPTSLAAYEDIKPKLGEKQAVIQRSLMLAAKAGKDMTNAEIASFLGWQINRVTPRVLELRELGLVIPAGIRTCGMTGRKVNAWTIPNSEAPPAPVKVASQEEQSQQINQLLLI